MITATIKINKNKIYEEINKYTSYMGDKKDNPDEYERLSTTDEDLIFFERMFAMAHSECINMLYPYTKDEILPNKYSTNTSEVNLNYDITLALPKYFSHTTIHLVENLICEYIISRLMSEWVMITEPNKHSYWIERYISVKKQICTALMSRTRPLERVLRPF